MAASGGNLLARLRRLAGFPPPTAPTCWRKAGGLLVTLCLVCLGISFLSRGAAEPPGTKPVPVVTNGSPAGVSTDLQRMNIPLMPEEKWFDPSSQQIRLDILNQKVLLAADKWNFVQVSNVFHHLSELFNQQPPLTSAAEFDFIKAKFDSLQAQIAGRARLVKEMEDALSAREANGNKLMQHDTPAHPEVIRQSNLAEERKTLLGLLMKYTEKHPTVAAQRKKIRKLEEEIAAPERGHETARKIRTVEINAMDEYRMDEQTLSLDQVIGTLQSDFEVDPLLTVLVIADTNASHREITELVHKLQTIGVKEFSLRTAKKVLGAPKVLGTPKYLPDLPPRRTMENEESNRSVVPFDGPLRVGPSYSRVAHGGSRFAPA